MIYLLFALLLAVVAHLDADHIWVGLVVVVQQLVQCGCLFVESFGISSPVKMTWFDLRIYFPG